MITIIYQGKQFIPYAAGDKIYGLGRNSPHIGGPLDTLGYHERDLKYQARREAMERRLKALREGNYMSPDVGRVI